MSIYFSHFPDTTHSGILVKDISRRAELTQTVLNDNYAFLPYLIEGDLKPEDVANFYYGSVRYTWLVYYSVGMVDPYFDWPLDSIQFDKYIINKYADQANTTGIEVLSWSMNELIEDNIVYYYNEFDDRISPESYTLNPTIVAGEWTAMRVYEYETKTNDDKRVIELLERSYAQRAEQELKDLLNDGLV